MQFLFSPLIGNLSDRFGRRPVLLISLVAMALDYILMAVAGAMWLLIVGRIIGGITAATGSTASAYMADISKPEEKAANFGLIGAAFGLGFVAGPLIGGLLASYGTRAPFYAAGMLAALNAALGYFVLVETVTDRIRRPFDWRRANPFGAFRQITKLPGLQPLIWVYFLYQVALFVYPAVWAYFARERFNWGPEMVGLALALFGIMMAIVQGGLIRLVLRWFGEVRTVIYGHMLEVFAFIVISLVTSGTFALILTPLAALGGVTGPALTAIMSRMVSDDAQGELQGILTSVNAVAMVVSPLLMTGVFAAFTHKDAAVYFPGAPFIVSGALILLGLTVFLRRGPSAVMS